MSEKGVLSEVEAIEAVRVLRTKPSFMATIVEGSPDFSLIHPFPTQPAEDKAIGSAFLEKLKPFLSENVDPDQIDRDAHIPKEVWEGLAELGCFGMNVPEEYGGLGMSETNYNRALMMIASRCDVVGLSMSVQSMGLSHPLKHFGTEEQRRKYLPLVTKDKIAAFALTEQDAGSDPSRMKAQVELSESGEYYILNGEKWYSSNSNIADYAIIMAKSPPYGPKDISAFILDMNAPGITRIPAYFMGHRGLENARLKFDNVRIPKEDMIGEEGKGLRIALTGLNNGRVSISALCLASAKRALGPTLWWAKERVQFGSSLGQYEANQVMIADMAADVFAMEAVTWLTSSLIDEGKTDLRIEAAASKLFCSESLVHGVLHGAMELRGGRGYETADSQRITGEPVVPVERWMRDAMIMPIGEGASNTLHLSLIRDLLDSSISKFFEFEKAKGLAKISKGLDFGSHMAKLAWKRFAPRGKSVVPLDLKNGPLGKHFEYIEAASKHLSDELFYWIVRYRERLKSKQLTTFRLIDICVDLFIMSVVCSYAHSLGDSRDRAIALADYFCNNTKVRIDEKFRGIKDNDDEQAVKLARSALAGKVDWLRMGIIEQDLN